MKNNFLLAALAVATATSQAAVLNFSDASVSVTGGSLTNISTTSTAPTEFTFTGLGTTLGLTNADLVVSIWNEGNFVGAGQGTGGEIDDSNIRNNQTATAGGDNAWHIEFSEDVQFEVEMIFNQVNFNGTAATYEQSIVEIDGQIGASTFTLLPSAADDGLPVVSTSGNTTTIGGLDNTSFVTGFPTSNGVDAPEWTILANGSGFSHTYEISSGSGQNSFQIDILGVAVPEPSSALLFGLGGLALLGRRKRA